MTCKRDYSSFFPKLQDKYQDIVQGLKCPPGQIRARTWNWVSFVTQWPDSTKLSPVSAQSPIKAILGKRSHFDNLYLGKNIRLSSS